MCVLSNTSQQNMSSSSNQQSQLSNMRKLMAMEVPLDIPQQLPLVLLAAALQSAKTLATRLGRAAAVLVVIPVGQPSGALWADCERCPIFSQQSGGVGGDTFQPSGRRHHRLLLRIWTIAAAAAAVHLLWLLSLRLLLLLLLARVAASTSDWRLATSTDSMLRATQMRHPVARTKTRTKTKPRTRTKW